ncbi:MAG: acyl-CoA dehydratase activase [Armatimonadota bacterium]|nr:acyl-CoA dehydratase activase [Armatimonadota bacterium]MCX7776942.1 acyl-CoA dehydratase activase [Armatimonadota bacterium]MDW8024776.1 acyl-CoA dehydratase activase [Armatimonadota bacterium]
MSAKEKPLKTFITYMREYSLLWHHIAKGLKLDVIPPNPPSRQTIDLAKGCGLDYWCYDLRLIFANMLAGAMNGGEIFIVPGGPGTCMLGHTTAVLIKPMIEKIAAKKVEWVIVNINPAIIFRTAFLSLLNEAKQLRRLSQRENVSDLKLLGLILNGLRKIKLYAHLNAFVIEHLHAVNDHDAAMSILKDAYRDMLNADSRSEIEEVHRKAVERLKCLLCQREPSVRVAIIGDFYTTMLSGFPSFDLLRFVSSQMQAQLVCVMDWWSFINPFGDLWGNGNYREGLRILGQRITGSDIITVCAALKARNRGVDGIIHLSAFGCTPEATAIGALNFFRDKHKLPPICSISFDEHTQPDAIKVRVEAFIDTLVFNKSGRPKKFDSIASASKLRSTVSEGARSKSNNEIIIGIDVGSITAKVVLLDAASLRLIYKSYERIHGNPIETLRCMLAEAGKHCNGKVISVGVTGSGRELIGAFVGADVIRNEVTAHAIAISHEIPSAKTVFEIGGQDAKLILLQDGAPVGFAMNSVCAAGTGAFLDHQAARLGIPIEAFGEIAKRAKRRARIGGRCTVFAESDMILRQQAGQPIEELIAGLCSALVRNYFNNVVSGRSIKPPYILCGGVAANSAIKDAFEEMLRHEVYVPEHFNVIGAIGAALLAAGACPQETSFRGFELPPLDSVADSFECDGCSNRCLIRRFISSTGVETCVGSMCYRW